MTVSTSSISDSKSAAKVRGVASPTDDLNQSIIKLLQDDGRMPYKDVARELDVSEGTIRDATTYRILTSTRHMDWRRSHTTSRRQWRRIIR